MKLALRPLAFVVCVSFTMGCSTSYMPAAGPRASIVIKDGKQAIARDGRVYDIGIFGGGLEEAVAGNARAEEHARAFNTDLTTGFACTMLSLAALLGGGTITAVKAADGTGNVSIPGIGLLAAGVALYVAGLVFLASAPPHFYDAMNIYNDGVDRLRPEGRAAPPPSATTGAPGWTFHPEKVSLVGVGGTP